jgi:Protein of unknown function (DUF3563)
MSAATLFSTDAAADVLRAPRPALARFWSHLWRFVNQSEREAYLAQATDLVDLELRQRAWERSMPDACSLSLAAWR